LIERELVCFARSAAPSLSTLFFTVLCLSARARSVKSDLYRFTVLYRSFPIRLTARALLDLARSERFRLIGARSLVNAFLYRFLILLFFAGSLDSADRA